MSLGVLLTGCAAPATVIDDPVREAELEAAATLYTTAYAGGNSQRPWDLLMEKRHEVMTFAEWDASIGLGPNEGARALPLQQGVEIFEGGITGMVDTTWGSPVNTVVADSFWVWEDDGWKFPYC